MKFIITINLSYLYIILLVAATLHGSCESRRGRSHLGQGEKGVACFHAIPGFQAVKCNNGLVCRTDEKCRPGTTGCIHYCLEPLYVAQGLKRHKRRRF
jgi:hypothetical protein